jgi:hypothetical protein
MLRRAAAAEQAHQTGPQREATPRRAATSDSQVRIHGVRRARAGLGAARGNYPRSARSK